TSPVTSFEAAVSSPCSCSCAIASGAHARAAMKVAVNATLHTVGLLFVELIMGQMWAVGSAGQWRGGSRGRSFRRPTFAFQLDPRTDRKNMRHHVGRARLRDDIA